MALTALRKDRLLTGIIIGAILPVIVLYIQYQMKFSSYTLNEFFDFINVNKKFFAGLATIALVVNGLLFGIGIHFKKYETARGIFIPTVIYGIALFVWKIM